MSGIEKTARANRIMHKQGFDTFYVCQSFMSQVNKNIEKNEKKLFVEYLKNTTGKILVFFIVLDRISRILTDEELASRANLDFMTEPVSITFFEKYLDDSIIDRIKSTDFYRELSDYFMTKDKMIPQVEDIIKNYYFDLDSLNSIAKQRHLLNLTQQFILTILERRLKISWFHIESSVFGYFTSIKSNYSRTELRSDEFVEYIKQSPQYNQSYKNVFISINKLFDENIILEHNNPLTQSEIDYISKLVEEKKNM